MAIRFSETAVKDPIGEYKSGSFLVCECGGKFKVKEMTQVSNYDREGNLKERSYCCPRCFDKKEDLVILIQDIFDPRPTLVQQANGMGDRSKT